MVGSRRRQVESADPVGQHAHPVAGKAAQNRRRCRRPEAGRRHARDLGERLADAGPELAVQFGLVEHRDSAEHVLGAALHAGDDDRLVLVGMGGAGVARHRVGRIGGGGQRSLRGGGSERNGGSDGRDGNERCFHGGSERG